MKKYEYLFLIVACVTLLAGCQRNKHQSYLLFTDSSDVERYGYRTTEGDTVIPFGKYPICFTDTFTVLAIVLSEKEGFIGINQKEEILFHVYPFDNGPDPIVEGRFRIIEKNRIGFASASGKIIVKPHYDAAFQFKNGMAPVAVGTTVTTAGEHSSWSGGEWGVIDTNGVVLVPLKYSSPETALSKVVR